MVWLCRATAVTAVAASLKEFGWRYTPYAYLLLKARGPEVDKVPPVRLDLDFMETSGYVVLPIESPTLPIDASAKAPPERPLAKLQVSQILDERQSDSQPPGRPLDAPIDL